MPVDGTITYDESADEDAGNCVTAVVDGCTGNGNAGKGVRSNTFDRPIPDSTFDRSDRGDFARFSAINLSIMSSGRSFVFLACGGVLSPRGVFSLGPLGGELRNGATVGRPLVLGERLLYDVIAASSTSCCSMSSCVSSAGIVISVSICVSAGTAISFPSYMVPGLLPVGFPNVAVDFSSSRLIASAIGFAIVLYKVLYVLCVSS